MEMSPTRNARVILARSSVTILPAVNKTGQLHHQTMSCVSSAHCDIQEHGATQLHTNYTLNVTIKLPRCLGQTTPSRSGSKITKQSARNSPDT